MDIVARLSLDPSSRTVGQLLQERGEALQEILRLRGQVDSAFAVRQSSIKTKPALEPIRIASHDVGPLRPGSLLSLRTVAALLGLSRSTVYRWVADGAFPPPFRVGARCVRWKAEALLEWQRSAEERG